MTTLINEELDSIVAQLVAYSHRHVGPKAQLAGVAAKYLGLRKEFGRVYEGMLSDPLLQEIIEESRLEIACGWRPSGHGSTNIYCDGCCLGNGKEGARAGYGIYITDASGSAIFSNGFRLSEDEPQTNQRAELTALLYALNYASETHDGVFDIYTDSRYAIDIMVRWAASWEAAGWRKADKKPVLHSDLVIACYNLYKDLGSRVTLHHIESHTGFTDIHSQGNAIADRLARSGAQKTSE
jgi:ribonuclease HI